MPDFEGDIELDGLTLPQYRAAVLIASGKKITDKTIAKELGVKESEVRSWKALPNFRFKIVQLFEETSSREMTARVYKMKRILTPLYREIKKRLEENELVNMRFESLINLMARIHNEIRIDHRTITSKLPLASKFTGGEEEQEDEYDIDDENILSRASSNYQTSREEAIKENSQKVVQLRK